MERVSAGGGIGVGMVGVLRSGRVSGTAMLVECPPSRRERVEVVWFNGTKSRLYLSRYAILPIRASRSGRSGLQT